MDPLVARDYIENWLKIRTKSSGIVPFKLNGAQEKLYAVARKQQEAGKPVRIIILKARQLGFSTLTEALIFHACATRQNCNALIVAHREDATANLFRMSQLYYDELPEQARPMVKIAPLWVLMPPVARNISSSACIPRGRSAAKVSGAGLREEEAPAEKQRAK